MCIFLRSSTSLTGISQYCFCVFQFTSYTVAGFAMNVVCTLLVATSFPRESESWERYESSATTRKFVPSAMCLLHTVVEYDRIIAIETSAIHSKKNKKLPRFVKKTSTTNSIWFWAIILYKDFRTSFLASKSRCWARQFIRFPLLPPCPWVFLSAPKN